MSAAATPPPATANDFADDRDAVFAALRGQAPQAPACALAPKMPEPSGDLRDVFIAAAAANGAQTARLAGLEELPQAVANFLRGQSAPLRVLCEEEFLPLPWAAAGIAAQCAAPNQQSVCGITGVNGAAADLGAVALCDTTPRRLTLSLLPPCHVAVARAAQLCPNLPALWRRLPRPLPRGVALARGPSLTADIEQTLTRGAHGPVAMLTALVG